jgi:hypothetical protein
LGRHPTRSLSERLMGLAPTDDLRVTGKIADSFFDQQVTRETPRVTMDATGADRALGLPREPTGDASV